MTGPRQFWTFHLAFWIAYLALVYAAVLPTSTVPPALLLAYKTQWAASGFLFSLGLRALYRRWLPRVQLWQLAGAVLIGCLATAALWLGSYSLVAAAGGTEMPSPSLFVRTYLGLAIALLIWSAAYITSALWQTAAAERFARTDAERLARAAELHALRQPLNPHFLFNALASVRALVVENPDRAREAITQLAELLRDSLQQSGDDLVPVSRELDYTRRYLALESMRFEERLAADVVADPAVANRLVPAFALRSLVENAVKHGRSRNGGPLEIHISVAPGEDDELRIVVTNSGSLAALPPNESATGLTNLHQRLRRLFPGAHSLTLADTNGTVTATLTLMSEHAS